MKAILVFDVDKLTYEAIEDYFTGDIKLRLGDELFHNFKDVILQPMPQRKKSLVVADGDGARFEEPTEFEQGYNSCIDEILGGEE